MNKKRILDACDTIKIQTENLYSKYILLRRGILEIMGAQKCMETEQPCDNGKHYVECKCISCIYSKLNTLLEDSK